MLRSPLKTSVRLLLALLTLSFACVAVAQLAIEERSFDNEAQKQRYHDLIAELRCPKCLNSNLAGSDAPIAADLRNEVHDQIIAGRSDDEIIDYLVERYGEFVLYDPPLHVGTALLWFGPLALLLLGFVIVRRMLSAPRDVSADAALTQEERQQLQDVLNKQAGQ